MTNLTAEARRLPGYCLLAIFLLGLFLLVFFQIPKALSSDSELIAQIPDDVPSTPEVIHRMKYVMDQSNHIEGGAGFLFGDKFLSAAGFYLRDTKYFSETLAIDGGLSFYKNSVTEEAQNLASLGASPTIHNPTYLIQAALLYEPVYGKFAVGSWIQHFRIGLMGGLHMAHETLFGLDGKEVDGFSQVVMRPNLGARVLFPVADKLSASLRGEWMSHGSPKGVESSSRNLWEWNFGLGYQL